MSDYHGFPSQAAYDAAKMAEAKAAAEAQQPRASRLYDDEIIICGHCRAERRAKAAKARKAKKP